MKPTNRQTGALGDELTNIMLATLIGLFGLALCFAQPEQSPHSS